MSKTKKIWNVALYARVSTDKKEQQESIPAQIDSLKKWLMDKSRSDDNAIYNLVEVYEDAGFSGSNFERESFIRMKEDIELHKINMIITRDLSRFARNYITAGYYLEDYFRVNGVRFVSILDNVDNIEEVNDIVPFKNILNEMYIKDCSRRSRDGLKQRMLRGSSIASKPLYGYKFETDYNGNVKTIKLVPAGDETTEVVREIFDLYLGGWGVDRIAAYLNRKGVLPPSSKHDNFAAAKYGLWNPGTIRYMLKNPKYYGMMVQGRWEKISYKLKKVRAISNDRWINGGEFEGIIPKEVFEQVQTQLKNRAKAFRYKQEPHLFSGVLKCHECGGSLSYRKKYEGYKCTNSQRGGNRCTAHSVKEELLKSTIIEDLKYHIKKHIDKDEIVDQEKEKIHRLIKHDTELVEVQNQIDKLDKQFEKIYMDKLNNIISQRNFESILSTIQRNQENLVRRKNELIEKKNIFKEHDAVFGAFIEKIRKIINLEEFDRIIVEALIDKIEVSENKKDKEKNIDIYYKFKN